MNKRGDKFMAQFEANKLTIKELEAIVRVLEPLETDAEVKAVLTKLRWHIAASRNEVEL